MFYKKGILKNFAKFTGKQLCLSLLYYTCPATLLKKRPWHMCFPVNFAKFLRTFFIENLRSLLLQLLAHLFRLNFVVKLKSVARKIIHSFTHV